MPVSPIEMRWRIFLRRSVKRLLLILLGVILVRAIMMWFSTTPDHARPDLYISASDDFRILSNLEGRRVPHYNSENLCPMDIREGLSRVIGPLSLPTQPHPGGSHETVDCPVKVSPPSERTTSPMPFFQDVGDTGVYVISAFLDVRIEVEHFVIVMALVPYKDFPLFCRFYDDNRNVFSASVPVRFKSVISWTPAWKACVWQEYLLRCPVPPQITGKVHAVSIIATPCGRPTNYMLVTTSGLRVPKPPEVATYGVCLPVLHAYNDEHIGLLVQFMEVSRKIGINVVYAYDLIGVSHNFERFLAYYVKIGFLKLVPWPIPEDVVSVFQFAGELVVNDCAYRHMDDIDYLFVTHLEELLVPLVHKTVPQAMAKLEAYYEKELCPGFSITRLETCQTKVPKSDPDHFVFPIERTEESRGVESFTRTIIKPKRVSVVDEHYIYKPFGKYLQHCGYDTVKRRNQAIVDHHLRVLVFTGENEVSCHGTAKGMDLGFQLILDDLPSMRHVSDEMAIINTAGNNKPSPVPGK